jgi:hypothetical protein
MAILTQITGTLAEKIIVTLVSNQTPLFPQKIVNNRRKIVIIALTPDCIHRNPLLPWLHF